MKENRLLKKKKIYKHILIFLLFLLIQQIITYPFLIFYGPFTNIRDSIVFMSKESFRFGFVSDFFLSDSAIDRIINGEDDSQKNSKDFTNEENTPPINLNSKNIIQVFNIRKNLGKAMIIKDSKKVIVGYSKYLNKKGETVSSMAKRFHCIAGINGGGFNDYKFSGNGGKATGPLIHNGKFLSGIPYSSVSRENLKTLIGFDDEGKLVIGKYYKNEIIKMKIKEAVSFDPFGRDPGLIINGKSTNNFSGRAPRTAIGQRKDGSVIFVVMDGRIISYLGATYDELRKIFFKFGAVNAAVLDGGSSTTMYLNGKTIMNSSSQTLGERFIPSSFLVLP